MSAAVTIPENFFDCDYFSLFGVPQGTALDLNDLRERYQSLQASAHPDRFANAPESQKRAAAQMAGRINDAWQTLSNPLSRAAYLLSLRGITAFAEDNTAMPPDFLMQQIEWREALEEAEDEDSRRAIYGDIARARDQCESDFARDLGENDDASATDNVRKWKYLEKLLEGQPAAGSSQRGE